MKYTIFKSEFKIEPEEAENSTSNGLKDSLSNAAF